MGQEKIALNSIEFVELVFSRILPKAKIRVIYDWEKSLQSTIEIKNLDYPQANLDLRLFLERYERYGITAGDDMTLQELRTLGAVPVPPSVSTGQGIPAADPFAAPAGGFDAFHDRVKGKK